jgi:hypothetical protein
MKHTLFLSFMAVVLAGMFAGCQKEIDMDLGDPQAGIPLPGDPDVFYYYKATIGGVSYQQVVTATNEWESASGIVGVDEVEVFGGIYHSGGAVPGAAYLTVRKGLFTDYQTATNNEFKAFFHTGEHPFTKGNFSNPYASGDGVIIELVDPQGEYWSTAAGTGDQSGSHFTVLSAEDDPDGSGTYFVKVKMQFNCKLYHSRTGEVKSLTGGEMVTAFGKL